MPNYQLYSAGQSLATCQAIGLFTPHCSPLSRKVRTFSRSKAKKRLQIVLHINEVILTITKLVMVDTNSFPKSLLHWLSLSKDERKMAS